MKTKGNSVEALKEMFDVLRVADPRSGGMKLTTPDVVAYGEEAEGKLESGRRLTNWLAFSFALAAWALTGCGTLDPAGVYAGDDVLYRSELTTTTSYEVIHTFVSWEQENRVALAKWPEIKIAADVMRGNAKQWFSTANALHDAYVGNPTETNREAYVVAVAVLRTALNEAAGYMAKAAK